MAANISHSRTIAGFITKRFATQISAGSSRFDSPLSASFLRVANYSSSYDKNIEDEVRPAVVPDYVIESDSDKYWCPHPQTGVFGPADPCFGAGASTDHVRAQSSDAATSTVLNETAWFRPLEDVQKPAPFA